MEPGREPVRVIDRRWGRFGWGDGAGHRRPLDECHARQAGIDLEHKDFTLLNVKTPYIGEIAGTDLYVPYVDLAARAAQLPKDKTAKIVIYCRSGNESAIAAQTLIDLGYTNIDNLDGGMNAWSASGRALVQVNRS